MKQRVAHGATIDAVTPQELAEALSNYGSQQATHDHHRERGIINLNASGVGSTTISLSRAFNWKMERVTIGGAGAVSALVQINDSDSGSDADMLEIIQLGTAGKYSDAFSNSLWIPAGNRLYITVAGGVASLQVTYNFQVLMVPVPK